MPGYVAALQRLEAMDGVQQETLRGADGQWLVVPRVPVSYATSI
jgi:hypothetical protein